MSSSILTSIGHTGHSADVKMRLQIGTSSFPVGQLGPGFLLLKKPVDHPPTKATMFLSVDDDERQWDVYLPDGISAGTRHVVIEPIA